MNYRDRIKSRREQLGLTQQDIADKLKTTKQTIHKYETGLIRRIDTETIEKLAEALQCTPGYIMGWELQEIPIRIIDELKDVPEIYVGIVKDAANSGLTPEELRDIIKFTANLKGGKV